MRVYYEAYARENRWYVLQDGKVWLVTMTWKTNLGRAKYVYTRLKPLPMSSAVEFFCKLEAGKIIEPGWQVEEEK